MGANSYQFVECWRVPGFSPREVYDVIADARLLPEWWKGVYLAAEPVDGEWTAPTVGRRVRVRARGFLPYTLGFILEATVLEPEHVVEVRTQGDFEGVWRATLAPDADGTRVDITWTVTVQKPVVRHLSPLLKPLFAWNHYWTTPRGAAGLNAYLTERRRGS